jgi:AraC-like DNA-binding protein
LDPGPLIPLLSSGGALVGLFVAGLLVVRPDANRRAGLVLSALMVLLSLSVVYPLLFAAWPALSGVHALVVIEPFQFLMTPLMGLYVRLLLIPDYRPRPAQLLHLLPFALIGVLSLIPIPAAGGERMHGLVPAATEALWALLVIQAFLYLLPVTRLLFRYRHWLRDEESSVAGIDLRWLWWFVHAFLALTTVYAVLLVVALHGPRAFPVRGYLSIALTVVVFVVGQRALLQKQPPLIEGLEKPEPARAGAAAGAAPRVVVTPEEAAEIKARLVRAMEVDRLYLDPELSLSDLVERLGATRNQVSYVINAHLGKNFYDFVNEYRVRDVVRQMNEKAADDLKIIALAFDAGFNSKPAFNSVFKKHTGLTPSEYRDRNRRTKKLPPAST